MLPNGVAITQEEAEEYQQVAALVCMDLDILLECANCGDMTAEELVAQIRHAHEQKESMTADPKIRQSRYEAASIIWNAVAQGHVRSEPL